MKKNKKNYRAVKDNNTLLGGKKPYKSQSNKKAMTFFRKYIIHFPIFSNHFIPFRLAVDSEPSTGTVDLGTQPE